MKLYKCILMVLLGGTLNINARIPKEVVENMTSSHRCEATNAAFSSFDSALQKMDPFPLRSGPLNLNTHKNIKTALNGLSKKTDSNSFRELLSKTTEWSIENLTPVIAEIRKDITPKIEQAKTVLVSKLPTAESISTIGKEISEKAIENLTPVITKTRKDIALKIEQAKTFLAAKITQVEALKNAGEATNEVPSSTKMECGSLENKLSDFKEAFEKLEPSAEKTSSSNSRFCDILNNRWTISAAVVIGIIIYTRYKYKKSQRQPEGDDYGL